MDCYFCNNDINKIVIFGILYLKMHIKISGNPLYTKKLCIIINLCD